MPTTTTLLGPDDVGVLRAMLGVFAEAFDDRDAYLGAPPDDAHLRGLLAGDAFIAVAAWADGAVVGGLAAYELRISSAGAATCTSTTRGGRAPPAAGPRHGDDPRAAGRGRAPRRVGVLRAGGLRR